MSASTYIVRGKAYLPIHDGFSNYPTYLTAKILVDLLSLRALVLNTSKLLQSGYNTNSFAKLKTRLAKVRRGLLQAKLHNELSPGYIKMLFESLLYVDMRPGEGILACWLSRYFVECVNWNEVHCTMEKKSFALNTSSSQMPFAAPDLVTDIVTYWFRKYSDWETRLACIMSKEDRLDRLETLFWEELGIPMARNDVLSLIMKWHGQMLDLSALHDCVDNEQCPARYGQLPEDLARFVGTTGCDDRWVCAKAGAMQFIMSIMRPFMLG